MPPQYLRPRAHAGVVRTAGVRARSTAPGGPRAGRAGGRTAGVRSAPWMHARVCMFVYSLEVFGSMWDACAGLNALGSAAGSSGLQLNALRLSVAVLPKLPAGRRYEYERAYVGRRQRGRRIGRETARRRAIPTSEMESWALYLRHPAHHSFLISNPTTKIDWEYGPKTLLTVAGIVIFFLHKKINNKKEEVM